MLCKLILNPPLCRLIVIVYHCLPSIVIALHYLALSYLSSSLALSPSSMGVVRLKSIGRRVIPLNANAKLIVTRNWIHNDVRGLAQCRTRNEEISRSTAPTQIRELINAITAIATPWCVDGAVRNSKSSTRIVPIYQMVTD